MENEQKTIENSASEAAVANSNGGNKPETQSLIERADALRQMLDEKEKRIDEKIARFDKILANSILSGRGEIVPIISQDEKDKAAANQIVKNLFG